MSKFRQLTQTNAPASNNLHASNLLTRVFSTTVVKAQPHTMNEMYIRRQNVDLADVVLQKSYKEEYLKYINQGVSDVKKQSIH
jgi:hypothetical protein